MRSLSAFVLVVILAPTSARAQVPTATAAPTATALPRADADIATATKLYKDGVELYNNGKVNEAITILENAVALEPSWALLRYDLGRMLSYESEYLDSQSIRATESAKLLREGDAADTAEVKAKNEDLAKGKDAEAQRLYQRAIADARAARDHLLFAVEGMPPEANVYYTLAKVCTTLGDFKSALTYLEKYIAMASPQGADLAKVQRAKERLQEAARQQELLDAAKSEPAPVTPGAR